MEKYLIVGLMFFALNCAKTDYYTRAVDSKVRFSSFSEEEGYKLKRRFELSHTRVNLFWGLVNVYKKDLELILLPELRNPDKQAVGNLSITESYDFLDSLVDFILVGIVRPYSVAVRGDLYEKMEDFKINEPDNEIQMDDSDRSLDKNKDSKTDTKPNLETESKPDSKIETETKPKTVKNKKGRK